MLAAEGLSHSDHKGKKTISPARLSETFFIAQGTN